MTAPTSLSLESNFELERIKRSIDAMDDLELLKHRCLSNSRSSMASMERLIRSSSKLDSRDKEVGAVISRKPV